MEILKKEEAAKYREKFINAFSDKSTKAYENISHPFSCSDGLCYLNYLWDTFANPALISEKQAWNFLQDKKEFFVMWDIHSKDFILIDDYWKYPKDTVIKLNITELAEKKETFPEDIYLFDETLSWTVALTHEEIDGKRYCLLVK